MGVAVPGRRRRARPRRRGHGAGRRATSPSSARRSCASRTVPATCCAAAAAVGTPSTTPASAASPSTRPSDDDWARVEAALGGVDVVIGPLEPDPATARFLDRVVARRRAAASASSTSCSGATSDREPVTDLTLGAAGGFTVLNGVLRGPAEPGRRRPRLQAGRAGHGRGGDGPRHGPPAHRAGRAHRGVGAGGRDRHDVPDVERQPLPLARDRAEPPRADRRRVDGAAAATGSGRRSRSTRRTTRASSSGPSATSVRPCCRDPEWTRPGVRRRATATS